MAPLALAKEDFSSPRFDLDQPAQELRRVVLVERALSYKEIADNMTRLGVPTSPETVRRWALGLQDTPASKLAPLYVAIGCRLSLLIATLQGTDITVVRRLPVSLRHCPQRLLEDMIIRFSSIFYIYGKVTRGEKLTAEEVRVLKEDAAQWKQLLDEIVETAEQSEEKK